MDIAIVTGAETPLGLRIVQTLVQQGCRVHGIGNNFSKVTYADPQFKAYAIDLTDLEDVATTLGGILEDEKRLDLLIHAIDVTPGAAFDKLPAGNLEAILKIGLLGPVMMTRLALPNLLRFRGQLINVITTNKHGHPASAANALIEGGLRRMNTALFDSGRDAGLRITNCLLRQNTELSDGSVSDAALAQSHINLDDVARTIEQLVDPKAVNVPQEIVLHPRLSAEAQDALPGTPLPLDAYEAVVLPPKEYHRPKQSKIPTEPKQQIERSIPYTDEEMEDKIAAAIEDFEANPERYEAPEPKQANQNQQQGGQAQQGQSKNKRRRRRRGGRNRNKNHQEGNAPKQDAAPEQKREAGSNDPSSGPESDSSQSSKKRSDQSNEKKPSQKSRRKKPAQETPAKPDTEKPAAKKAVKKKAAKKAAKKMVKKVVKKAAKKAAKKKSAKKVVRKQASPED